MHMGKTDMGLNLFRPVYISEFMVCCSCDLRVKGRLKFEKHHFVVMICCAIYFVKIHELLL